MRPGVHYNHTYDPVMAWESIRIMLSTLLKNNQKTMQLDYVLYFTQAPFERECYMNIPQVIKVNNDNEWVLKVNNNIYGQLQTDRSQNKFLM